jgi:NitT/TauT family transport system substrate-binding protein
MNTLTRLLIAFLVLALGAGVMNLALTPVQATDTRPFTPPQTAQEDLTTLRVGLVPVLIYAPVFIADARGYFADEGLQIEITNVAGGSEPLAPLARNELDVVFGGTGAGLFNYAARNLDTEEDAMFRIVAGAHSEDAPVTSPLVVSRERFESGELTSIADLAGGRVAINAPGAATEYWMYKALEQGGLSFEDVELVSVAFPDVAAALNSEAEDRIDAAILGEPLASLAENQGLVARLSTDFIEDFQPTFVYMSNDFLANDREVAVAFLRALLRAYRDLQDPATWAEEDVLVALGSATQGYSVDLLDLYAFPQYDPNGRIQAEDMEVLQEYFLGGDLLTYDEALDLSLLIDDSVLAEAVAELGPYEE